MVVTDDHREERNFMKGKGNIAKLFNLIKSLPPINFITGKGHIAGLHPSFDNKGKIFLRIAVFDISPNSNKKRRFIKNSKTYSLKEAERKLLDCAQKFGWKRADWNEAWG